MQCVLIVVCLCLMVVCVKAGLVAVLVVVVGDVCLSRCRAHGDFRDIVGVTFMLQPVLSVPVSPVRAALQLRAPPAVQLHGARHLLGLLAGDAGLTVCVRVAGLQGFKQYGCLIPDLFVLHIQSVVFIDSLPSSKIHSPVYDVSI